MSDRPTLADVFLAGEDDAEGSCSVCGDDIERWQRVVWTLVPEMGENAILLDHLWCAIQNDAVDLGTVFTDAWGRPAPKKAKR